MPLSKKRKTKSGKPVRYQSRRGDRSSAAPPPVATGSLKGQDTRSAEEVLEDMLDVEDVAAPEPRLFFRETGDVPVFWSGGYYRGELPARMVGGYHVRAQAMAVSIGNGPREWFRWDRGFETRLVHAMDRDVPIYLYGFSCHLNVVYGPLMSRGILGALGENSVQRGFWRGFVAAMRVAGMPLWLGIDDDIAAYDWPVHLLAWRDQPMSPGAYEQRVAVAEAYMAARDRFLRAVLAGAAGTVVATEPLAALACGTARAFRVIPNAVDLADYAQTAKRPDGPAIHLGLAGLDWKWQWDNAHFLPAILDAARRPNVVLHLFGLDRDDEPLDLGAYDLAGVSLRRHPYQPYVAYQHAIGILDILACPLNPRLLWNRGRSGQKWMEAALHGTACVLQRLAPHDLAIEDVHCLKADEPAEWCEQLTRLVDDVGLRRRIGEAAREEVLAKHTLEARRPMWEALVSEARGHAAEAA